MDLASAKVIGAGLAAIGVGVAAIGVGNVFGSFLESAMRNPAAADGQQGRLFIGFAAAELLGLIAFAVAMIILFVDQVYGRGAPFAAGEGTRCLNSTSSRSSPIRSSSGCCWCLALIYFGIGKAMLPKIQSTVEARDKRIADDLAAAEAARVAADETEAAYRARDGREPRRGAQGRGRRQGVLRQGDRGADARRQ